MKNRNGNKIGKKMLTMGLAIVLSCSAVMGNVTIAKAAEVKDYMGYKSVSDISGDLIRDGKTMEFYVNSYPAEPEWQFSDTYDATGRVTLYPANQYLYNRLTNEEGSQDDKASDARYATAIAKGGIVFDGTGNIPDNTGYTIYDELKDVDNGEYPGYHTYDYIPPEGTQIPLAGWELAARQEYAIHAETFNVLDYPDGGNRGLIDRSRWSRWAMYNGVEFYSVTTDIVLPEGKEASPCASITWGWKYNNPTWEPICAVCGKYTSSSVKAEGGLVANVYATIDAIETLPVVTQGQEFVITCPHCGGMETNAYFYHVCKAISPNRYVVKYDDGTSDSSVSGRTPDGIWYYNFATEYNGAAVTDQTKRISECGFTRPGYAFKGWSLTNGGNVDFAAGDGILGLQAKLSSLTDGTSITLYAVWEVNKSYFKIDANTDTYNGGAAYDGKTVWVSNQTAYKNASGVVNTYTLDESKITPPTGYKATFNVEGSTTKVPAKTAATRYTGYTFVTTDNNGTMSGNKYTFGPENRTEAQADTIKLQYTQDPIILPAASSTTASFVGWYADSSYTTYVGGAGDSYTLTGNVTLYARFANLTVQAADIYYKNSSGNSFGNIAKNADGTANNAASTPSNALAVWNATGAVNLKMSLFTLGDWTPIYEPNMKKTGTNGWTAFSTTSGSGDSVAENAYDEDYTANGTYSVKSTGLYKINAYGAQGKDFGTNAGGKGGQAYGIFYLKEGDTLTVSIGKQNGTNGGGSSTNTNKGSNGGGYTKVTSAALGNLLIAGGGGGASEKEGGYAGGSSAGLRDDSSSSGASGMAGGGGGAVGGKAGTYETHTCDSSCSETDDGTKTAGSTFYSSGESSVPTDDDINSSYRTGSTYAEASSIEYLSKKVSVTAGSQTKYLETPHAGTLTFTVDNLFWEDSHCACGLSFASELVVYVYNQSGTQLYKASSKDLSHTTNTSNAYYCGENPCWNEAHKQTITKWTYNDANATGTRTMKNGLSWQHHTTLVFDGRDYEDEITITFNIPIAEGTSGIYIKCENVITGGGSTTVAAKFGAEIRNVSFKYEYSNKICGYTDGQVISSNGAYGGSNYVNETVAQPSTTGNLAGKNTGDGSVKITGVNIGLKDGSDNDVEILGVKATDTAAPGSVGTLTENGNNIQWTTAVSNGTSYDFMVKAYRLPDSGSTLKLEQTSDTITKVLTSAIAGYYCVFDKSSTTNVATTINGLYAKPAYTWTDSNYTKTADYINSSKSNRKVVFTQALSVAKDTAYTYLHVAAVDVAGNIGSTSHIAISTISSVQLCRITFDTNHLLYQLNPESSVNAGNWNADGKTTSLTATGENVQNAFYRGYYAVAGTDIANNNRGSFGSSLNLKFGGAFPIPSATGCTFVGWNTKPDGSGTYHSADGTNIGYSGITDSKFVPGDGNRGKDITLYAIWGDVEKGTTISNIQNANAISKNYVKTITNADTGVRLVSGYPMPLKENGTNAADTSWTNSSTVNIAAQFEASGVYAITQNMYNRYGTTIASVKGYVTGVGNNATLTHIMNSSGVQETTYNGAASLTDSLYSSGKKNFSVSYNVQGTYKISGEAISRTYATEAVGSIGRQGYPARMTTSELTIKIDKTSPVISSCEVVTDSLNNYTIAQIPGAIARGLDTKFTVRVSDYNNVALGSSPGSSTGDSSGILGVYVVVTDVNNPAIQKVYPMTVESGYTETNNNDKNVLSGTYKLSKNFYGEFPYSGALQYYVYAVDNAGNVSEISEGFMGVVSNFSIKTVFYNDEDKAFNTEDCSYFQVGDIGHVEVWTIGYTDSVQLNFGEMGEEAKKEIESGKLSKSYNMGLLTEGWTRVIPHTKSTPMPSPYPVNSEGVAYAQHYSISGWNNSGMSVRIPPYYKLTPDGDKKNSDGTPQYKWEKWAYEAVAHKKNLTASATSLYVLWDTRNNDVHYRVIHETVPDKLK